MKVSEAIQGLQEILESVGDLDICYSIDDKETAHIKSVPIIYGGAGNFGPDGGTIAFFSSSESIKELFQN